MHNAVVEYMHVRFDNLIILQFLLIFFSFKALFHETKEFSFSRKNGQYCASIICKKFLQCSRDTGKHIS
jgi:hypothetical protein